MTPGEISGTAEAAHARHGRPLGEKLGAVTTHPVGTGGMPLDELLFQG